MLVVTIIKVTIIPDIIHHLHLIIFIIIDIIIIIIVITIMINLAAVSPAGFQLEVK